MKNRASKFHQSEIDEQELNYPSMPLGRLQAAAAAAVIPILIG
jgi:hypothetical protein